MRYVFEGAPKWPGVAITLSDDEMEWVRGVAQKRQSEAVRMNLPDRHGYSGDGLKVHIQGAAGEYAVASAIGVEWDATVNTFKYGGDVGSLQVRTRSNHAWDLILRKDDRPDDTFYLVTGEPPHLRIVGSITARDGMVDEHIARHGGRPAAWFVPHAALKPFRLADRKAIDNSS